MMRLRERMGGNKTEGGCSKVSHLLVLGFLHGLIDVIEDLPAAVGRLLHFVLLGCVV